MKKPETSRLISAAVRPVLTPLGFRQRGRSRFWNDDQGWYAQAIEFQPFSGRPAVALNHGICWLWVPKDYWSFDLGYRQTDFVDYKTDMQFSAAAQGMAEMAAANALAIRQTFRDVAGARVAAARRQPDNWTDFHLAFLHGLTGQQEAALHHAAKAMIANPDDDWRREFNRSVRELQSALSDIDAFPSFARAKITQTRALLKLPDLADPLAGVMQ